MAAVLQESHAIVEAPLTLVALRTGARGKVLTVTSEDPALRRRLIEIGFIAGEPFEVLAKAWPGADPLAVRIGASMFALRQREAAAVQVELDRA